MSFDHILIVGFGGPAQPGELRPFLEQVTRGLGIPEERLQQVLQHYEAIGGVSPYNRHVFQLVEKLKDQLFRKGIVLPVFVGMRNWHPFLKDTMAEIKKKGFKKGIGVILAPQRSDASFDKYMRNVEEAKQAAEAPFIECEYLKAWHDHPFFIEAQADQVRQVLATLAPKELAELHFIFTAHSIPVEMAQACRYVQEFETSSSRVAHELGWEKWSLAYQSRSGNPKQPWLEPDVTQEIRRLSTKGIRTVLLVPAGFINDNVEVLYDLDIEARQAALQSGLGYRRASTVMDHPKFVKMFAELIEEVTARQIC